MTIATRSLFCLVVLTLSTWAFSCGLEETPGNVSNVKAKNAKAYLNPRGWEIPGLEGATIEKHGEVTNLGQVFQDPETLFKEFTFTNFLIKDELETDFPILGSTTDGAIVVIGTEKRRLSNLTRYEYRGVPFAYLAMTGEYGGQDVFAKFKKVETQKDLRKRIAAMQSWGRGTMKEHFILGGASACGALALIFRDMDGDGKFETLTWYDADVGGYPIPQNASEEDLKRLARENDHRIIVPGWVRAQVPSPQTPTSAK
jgi:hypothetical protein